MGLLRRIFGLPSRDDTLKDRFQTRRDAEKPVMKDRYRRMGNLGTKQPELQLKDLLHVLNSTIQEVEVIKRTLKENNLWDDSLYKKLRLETMINDHSTAGVNPWESTSMYPYTLEESEFLRHVFDASDDEVSAFESEVKRGHLR
jgi:hypothetical protein